MRGMKTVGGDWAQLFWDLLFELCWVAIEVGDSLSFVYCEADTSVLGNILLKSQQKRTISPIQMPPNQV